MEKKKELHIVTTGKQTDLEIVSITKQVHAYVDAIHIREKDKSAAELYGLINKLIETGVPQQKLYVNDRIDIAHALKLRGVQLAFHSLPIQIAKQAFPHLRFGCSIHSLEEAELAKKAGADYILYGHIFQTESKPGLSPRGTAAIKKIKKHTQLPLIAIGGITPDNAESVIQAGADGIAIMSGIFESSSPLNTVKEYAKVLT